jgi:hypothetical protein
MGAYLTLYQLALTWRRLGLTDPIIHAFIHGGVVPSPSLNAVTRMHTTFPDYAAWRRWHEQAPARRRALERAVPTTRLWSVEDAAGG